MREEGGGGGPPSFEAGSREKMIRLARRLTAARMPPPSGPRGLCSTAIQAVAPSAVRSDRCELELLYECGTVCSSSCCWEGVIS